MKGAVVSNEALFQDKQEQEIFVQALLAQINRFPLSRPELAGEQAWKFVEEYRLRSRPARRAARTEPA